MLAWGLNQFGQLGDSSDDDKPTPVQVAGVEGAVQIDAGRDHSMAVLGDGTLIGWGQGYNLGTDELSLETPVNVLEGLRVPE